MISFWEKESFLAHDLLIIGGGIAGLCSALSLRERFPSRRITVLERGLLPSGASTRNAGLATFGSVSEILCDLRKMSETDVQNLVQRRYEGLQLLRQRLGDEAMEYTADGGYEFIFRNETIGPDQVERVNALLHPLFDKDVFRIDNSVIQKFQFNKNFIRYCITNPLEGQLHSGKMMRRLMQLCCAQNIEIKTGAELMWYEEQDENIVVSVKDATGKRTINCTAQQIIFCTNAFTGDFFPDLDITPGRGQVLVTKPIPNLPFRGSFHFDEGYFYFRNVGSRVLFGGGRNFDFDAEKTTETGLNEGIQQKLDYYLKNLILPRYTYETEMRWSGIMAFGKEKSPIVKKVNERIYLAVRMNGIGVALAAKVGEEVASMIV